MENNAKIAKATSLTTEEIAVIKSTVAKGTTDLELSYFLMTANSVGLSPFNKEVWCYKDHKQNLIVFAGRDGFLKIAQRDSRWNGLVSSEVRENDTFEIDFPNGQITHKIKMADRGKIIGAYCYIKPKGCDTATIEWVDFATYNRDFSVWKSHPADMIKKVAETKTLKKAFGISGLASEYEFDVVNEKVLAIDTENKPSPSDTAYLEKLIDNSAYDDEMREVLRDKLHDITWAEYEQTKSNLQVNQLDPMDGRGYGQGDILDKLKKHV